MSQKDNITSDGNVDYLFGPRLSFLASQDELVANCKVSLSQHLHDSPKKRSEEMENLVGELKSSQDIFNAYGVFYSLIYFCRFDEKGVLQTSGQSKEELRRKKVKDIESQKKAKIKKTLSTMGQSQSNYDSWMEVINHKNLFKHITQAQTYLKKIVDSNFEVVGKGVPKIKNSQLQNGLQIRLCVLVIDIISLINTMKFMLNPFTQTDALVSKLIQQETLLFKEAFSKLNANGQLDGVDELNSKMFYDALKFLMSQCSSQNKKLKYWFDMEEIRRRYLIGENDLIRVKPTQFIQKKINSGIISANDAPTYEITEIQLEWLNISNSYVLSTKESMNQNLSRIFREYSQFFNYNIDEMIRRQEKQEIIQKYVEYYFSLIKNIWTQLDRSSAEALYIDEVFKINNKIKLPLPFVKSASGIVKEMIEQQVFNFTQTKNEEYLKKLKSMAFDLSEKLLRLQPRDDLIDDYFVVLQKSVIALLSERQAMDKLFQKVYSLQTNIKLSEFFDIISKIQSLISDASFQSAIKSSNNRKENFNDVIESLYKTYEDEKNLIDEIKYFLKIVKALSKIEANEDELQNTKKFYSNKRNDIFSSENVISPQKLSTLPYGLMDLIRILTLELVLKIKLKINSKEIDEDQKFLFKILKFYQKEKEKFKVQAQEETIEETQSNEIRENEENQDWDPDLEATELLLKNVRSKSVNFDDLRIQLTEQDELATGQQSRFFNFATDFIKKIYELRLEIVRKNIKEHELKQKPLEKDFIEMKNIIYTTIKKTEKNDIFHQELSELAQIQYLFIKKRHYKAWRAIRKLTKIEEIKDLLETVWTRDRNVLKIHIKLFLKYQEIYFSSKLIFNRNDISQSEVTNLVDDVLKTEPTIVNISNLEETKQFVSELKAAVKILDRIEKVEILRREIEKRDEQKRSLQEAKTYDLIEENNQFPILNGKLKIYRVQKLGVVMMRKYIIKCPTKDIKSLEGKLKVLKKLCLNNINVKNKDSDKIQITVDEVQNQFDSYPKLVRYLIEAYHRIVNFCKNQLHVKLYPILKKKDFEFTAKNDRHFSLKINPYEGILLNLLLSYEELKKSGLFIYPKHPFVAFSNEVKEKFRDEKIYILKSTDKNISTEEYGFQHLIDQMRSISLENDANNLNLVVENILKCPYFWSSTDKSFELVEFKERLHSMVNAEQCRRKQNNRLIRRLEEESEEWEDPTAHKEYKKSYGYSKLTQMYLSIEGVMEKQAFLEDIGNFRKYGRHEQFRLQNYQWDLDYDCEEKKELKNLIQMIAKKQRKKGNKNSTLYKKTFPSFNTQIRHLRNLLSHYIYDDENKIEYSLDYKLRLIEKSFAKIFVFIYRWKNYLNKNFEEIKDQRVKLLLSIFKEHDKVEMIERLLEIPELQKYSKVNNNINYFLNMFKYSFENRNDCEACNILCLVFRRKSSLWELLADDYKKKEGKIIQNPPYNHFFYEHRAVGCNGMQFLLPYFFNTIRRDNFTAEEAALIRSPIVALRLQAEKINNKIKRLMMQGHNEDESWQDSDNDSNDQPATERRETLPIEKRCEQLSEHQKQKYFEDMHKLDYVNKNTIYQFELRFPFVFDDLRRERYQWDFNARKFDD